VKRPKLHPADAQLQALRAELEALGPVVVLPKGPLRIAYVALGCAPAGSGDGGML
jgi:hypothetical protein